MTLSFSIVIRVIVSLGRRFRPRVWSIRTHIHAPVKLSSWGLVYYNNILALALFPVGYLLTSEGGSGVGLQDSMHAIFERLVNAQALLPVVISCVFGLGISFFAMSCRKALSATTFTGAPKRNPFRSGN